MRKTSKIRAAFCMLIASCVLGCGSNEMEREYESAVRETMASMKKVVPPDQLEARVKSAVNDFKKMSAEGQKAELEKTRQFLEGLRKM